MTARRDFMACSLLTASLAALGCSGGSPGGSQGNPCAATALNECAQDPACELSTAKLVVPTTALSSDASAKCLLPPQELVCAAKGCGGADVQAKDSFNQTWVLPDACVPSSWVRTTAPQSATDCPSCDDMAEAACGAAAYCQSLRGRRIDQAKACAQSADEYIGCHWTYVGCGGAETQAQDPTGQRWLLPSTCVPANWTATSPNGVPICMN